MRWAAVWAAALLALAAACSSGGGDSGGATPGPGQGTTTNHSLGLAEAPLLLVEYGDFQ